MKQDLDILIVDDDLTQAELLAESVTRLGHRAHAFRDTDAAIDWLRVKGAHLVITDLRMPGRDGLAFLRIVKEIDTDLEVLLVTGHATVQTAVEAMRLGALDYLEKPVDAGLLKGKLALVVERVSLRRVNRTLRDQLERVQPSTIPLGKNPKFKAVLGQLEKAAMSDAPIMLQGETGTGKEVLARHLHKCSARGRGPFVAVNCGAIPETLLESEFFGHTRGAFTGADRARPGRIEEAAGGTLFLDEIGELSLALQPKLLRVLQDHEYQRLGDNQTRRADVRWVSATHRIIGAMVKDGSFREDLFYRLAVLTLSIPPLRERADDIPLFFQEIMHRKAKTYKMEPKILTSEALEALIAWRWPGNVRELENTIERILLLASGTTIDLGDLPEGFDENVEPGSWSNNQGLSLPNQVEALERKILTEGLDLTAGNQSEAARRLGINERTLRYKMRKLGIPTSNRG
jgi:DNA-binding NtrC family response regulator